MSAVSQVFSFQFPVSSEEAALHVAHGGAVPQRSVELPRVMPASRLENRPAAAAVRSAIEELDALTGGLPRGGLSEICGPASSGRSSVLLAMMARMTAEGEVCALVDASDSFDPKSAEAAGVELKRLLWVRCTKNRMIGRSGDRANKTASVADSRWSMAKTSVAIDG
jgi:predicted ATP-dependent serine protease